MGAVDYNQLTRAMDEHGSALVLYAHQFCDTPEDVVQEAFLRLMRQKAAPDNMAGWLFRVVRNAAISASRAAARRSRYETNATERNQDWFVPSNDARLDAAAATRALDDLPIAQREVIVPRLWGGLGFGEIAQLTGSSTSTVHRHYRAGLEMLRERLGVACPRKT